MNDYPQTMVRLAQDMAGVAALEIGDGVTPNEVWVAERTERNDTIELHVSFTQRIHYSIPIAIQTKNLYHNESVANAVALIMKEAFVENVPKLKKAVIAANAAAHAELVEK